MAKVTVIFKESTHKIYSASDSAGLLAYMQKGSAHVKGMEEARDEHERTLEEVIRVIDRHGVGCNAIYRGELSGMDEERRRELIQNAQLLITVGGDGTFMEASHYIPEGSATPLLGVNSDPARSTAFYSIANMQTFEGILGQALEGKLTKLLLPRLSIEVNGKRIAELVINDVRLKNSGDDLFRYDLSVDGAVKSGLRSDGILACTPSGYTGWMVDFPGSIYLPLGSKDMQYYLMGKPVPPELAKQSIEISSLTREGIMHVDGVHVQYEFSIGDVIRITPGEPLTFLGELEGKRAAYAARKFEELLTAIPVFEQRARANLELVRGRA
ncbi:NAD(+)/NADH kinase [Candidatus Woesearchaeota archaeon]|nr:NAD(+)/NADH kinase [Candidatus Woesearchaeota archaeon]